MLQTIRPELLSLSADQLHSISPFLSVFAGTVIAILVSVLIPKPKWPVFIITLLTLLAGFAWSLCLWRGTGTMLLFNNMAVSDYFSNLFNLLFLMAGAITALASFRYLDREGLQHPEY